MTDQYSITIDEDQRVILLHALKRIGLPSAEEKIQIQLLAMLEALPSEYVNVQGLSGHARARKLRKARNPTSPWHARAEKQWKE
jgi:hypothetical protein